MAQNMGLISHKRYCCCITVSLVHCVQQARRLRLLVLCSMHFFVIERKALLRLNWSSPLLQHHFSYSPPTNSTCPPHYAPFLVADGRREVFLMVCEDLKNTTCPLHFCTFGLSCKMGMFACYFKTACPTRQRDPQMKGKLHALKGNSEKS